MKDKFFETFKTNANVSKRNKNRNIRSLHHQVVKVYKNLKI